MPQEMFSSDHLLTLREITEGSLSEILKLEVLDNQKAFVAPNSVSIAQAHYSKTAWFRGIYHDETPVGFVMLDLDESKPDYFLWRLMIDKSHQHKEYGKLAMEMVIDYVSTLPNAKELLTSCVPGENSPEVFYSHMGFKFTGDMIENEKVYCYALLE